MRALAVISLMVCVLAAGSAQANLLLNPGFLGTENAIPTDWTGSGYAKSQGWGNHDGDGRYLVMEGWMMPGPHWVYQDVEGDPNTVYTLEVWQESDPDWNGTALSAQLIWLDGGGNPVGTAASVSMQGTAVGENVWHQYILQGTSPGSMDKVRVKFEGTPGGSGTAKLDDLDLTGMAIPEPSALALLAMGALVLGYVRGRVRR